MDDSSSTRRQALRLGYINIKSSILPIYQPTYVRRFSSFLRHAEFYYRFFQNSSKIAKPLPNLLLKDVPFHFSKKCTKAFTKLKEALTTAAILHPFIYGRPFELLCDTSEYAVGVVLG